LKASVQLLVLEHWQIVSSDGYSWTLEDLFRVAGSK
jgi:hypothetical protein